MHGTEVSVQDNEEMIRVSHAKAGERKKENALHWPVRHAAPHLSTHSADRGLHRRHAMNMTKYQTQEAAPPGL